MQLLILLKKKIGFAHLKEFASIDEVDRYLNPKPNVNMEKIKKQLSQYKNDQLFDNKVFLE